MPSLSIGKNRFPGTLGTLATALATTFATGMAHAETSPYFIGAKQTFTSDSNVLRLPDHLNTGTDTISSTGIFAGINQPFGRQRVTASLSTNVNRYKQNSQLNNTDGLAQIRLDWSTIGRLSGEAQVTKRQELYRYDLNNSVDPSRKVVLHDTNAFLQARIGVVTLWTFEGGIAASRTDFSTDLLRNNDADQQSYNLGVRYGAPADPLRLGATLRHTDVKHPHAVDSDGNPHDNRFKRADLGLSATWEPTGTSTLRARINRTRLDYDIANQPATTTTTGALSYDWHPEGRTAFTLSASRDNNAGSSSFDTPLVSGVSTDTRMSTNVSLAVRYELTSKIQLQANAGQTRRDIDNRLDQSVLGNPLASTLRHAKDRTDFYGLNASYDFSRALQLACSLQRRHRSVLEDDIVALTYPYRETATSCTIQFELHP